MQAIQNLLNLGETGIIESFTEVNNFLSFITGFDKVGTELPADETPVADEPWADDTVADDSILYMLGSFAEPDDPAIEEALVDEPQVETEEPPADPESNPEIYTLGDPEPEPQPEPSANCTADAEYAAAVDLVLIGPFTPEQFAAQSTAAQSPYGLRLEDLIALLAVDTERRREATVLNAVPVACS
jgi:hypothetical protein